MISLFLIKKEYLHEESLFRDVNELAISKRVGSMAKVHDVQQGNFFWIAVNKLKKAE